MNISHRSETLLRHALPLMLALLFLAHALLVAVIFDDPVAWMVLTACALAIFFCYVGFSTARRIFPRRILAIPRGGLVGPGAIVTCFIGVAFSLAVTAPELAIVVSASGGDVNEIAEAREAFAKTREGFELALVYAHAMILKGALPLALVSLFVIGHRLRWLFLIISVVLLLASLEKFLTALVLIPIGIYFGLVGDYRRLLRFLVFAFAMFMVAASLSRIGSDADELAEAPRTAVDWKAFGASLNSPRMALPDRVLEKVIARHEKIQVVALSDVPFYQFAPVLSPELILVNRAMWIPFVTVYDTFRYWLEMQDGRHLLGITSRPVALIHGEEFLYLEREVFRFQFGGDDATTGNSNAAFFADAYVNFGVFGIILLAFLVGGFLGWISTIEHPACSAAGAVMAYGFAGSAVLPMLSSGGVWLFVLIALAWSRRARRSTGRPGLQA
jgi:hypothetical protein